MRGMPTLCAAGCVPLLNRGLIGLADRATSALVVEPVAPDDVSYVDALRCAVPAYIREAAETGIAPVASMSSL